MWRGGYATAVLHRLKRSRTYEAPGNRPMCIWFPLLQTLDRIDLGPSMSVSRPPRNSGGWEGINRALECNGGGWGFQNQR